MEAQRQHDPRTLRNLAIFTVLVLGLGWLGRGVDALTGGSATSGGIGQLIWLLAPLVASFPLRAFGGDGWRDLGIRLRFKGNVLWYAISILIYPVCFTLVLVIGSALGAVSFPAFSSDTVGVFVQAFALTLVPQFFINILEESGFRGYLAPKLYRLDLNVFVAHALVGLIWGAWHLPYFSFVTSYTTESLATLVPRFLAGTIAASIVYGEIRILTDSLWPAVLMQTVGGAFASALVLQDHFKVAGGMEFIFAPVVEGGLIIVLFALIGVGIHRLRMGQTTVDQP